MSVPHFPFALQLDDDLLGRQAHGEEVAERVARLYQQHREPVLRYLLTLGLSVADGEEVAQDVFLALHQHLQQNKPDEHLRGWIFRVAHNQGLKARLRAAKRSDLVTEPYEAALDPEQLAVRNQMERKLAAVLAALPENDRACLTLRAEGLRYREIAQVLGISLGSVAACVARALEKMQSVCGTAVQVTR